MPEFTFLGVINQPDFGEVLLIFYPNEWTIEDNKLKEIMDAEYRADHAPQGSWAKMLGTVLFKKEE